MSDTSAIDLFNTVQQASSGNVALPSTESLFNQLIPSGMLNPWFLTISGLFSLVGLYQLAYAKREKEFIPAMSGIGLCLYPIFVSNLFWLILIGIILSLLPWGWSRLK